jgi:Bacterial Ig-like domain (group 3)
MAVAGAVVPLAIVAASPATVSAAPIRTATTTSYNDAVYLQHELGLPTTDTSPVIQSVTYDRFQWLLQQSGNYAFLIGDPAEDANFATEAQEVEATAETDGVHTIYWFDPNLSGGGTLTSQVGATEVGSIYEPNLDIRNPSEVGELPSTTSTPTGTYAVSAATQAIYGNAWDNLVAQGLGDGISVDLYEPDTESSQIKAALVGSSATPVTVANGSVNTTLSPGTNETFDQGATAATPTSSFNDYGANAGYSTEISNGAPNVNGGALYDYSSGTAPADATSTNSVFFTYNNANTVNVSGTPEPQKILNWINLDTESSAANLEADLTTVLGHAEANTAGGASGLASPDQFAWWESEATAKQNQQGNTSPTLAIQPNADGGNIPLLTSADDSASDGGWRIDQITYPELVDLLKNGANTSNAVILFGGTWCPNTRPVIPFVNQYAQANNVTVFNFDTVLDGGTTGGNTTGSTNPLQVRNSVANGGTTNANPTSLYGDLVNTYLKNIDTQYTPTSSSVVTYYPGGNTALPSTTTANKLQVPFLIGYKASDGGGVTRQWIIDNGNNSYTEYMSDWWYTNPQPGEIGISASTLPYDAPIWSTINSELASATWQTDPATVDPNTAIVNDDAQYLDSADVASLKFTPSTGTATSVTAASGAPGSGAVSIGSISPAALSAALAALGSSAPASYSAASTALLAAYNANPTSALTTNLETVYGAWGVVQRRKTSLLGAWGNATSPGSVLGGLAADHALDVFFAGLPGGVVSTQTVTANAVNYGKELDISVAIANQFGRIPTGNVSLVAQSGSTTLATTSTPVVNDVASFKVPINGAGTYSYAVSYQGDDQIATFDDTGTLTVPPNPAAAVTVTPTPTPTPTPAPATPAAVAKIKVRKVAGSVIKASTIRTAGKYRVKITSPSGKAAATGKVTIKVRKGATTKTITGRLSNGVVTFTVPKLTSGTWKVAISWAGDSDYLAASATGPSIKVKAAKVAKKASKKKK